MNPQTQTTRAKMFASSGTMITFKEQSQGSRKSLDVIRGGTEPHASSLQPSNILNFVSLILAFWGIIPYWHADSEDQTQGTTEVTQ